MFNFLPDEHLPQVPCAVSVDVLLGGGQLQVHVVVRRHQESLVLVAPLELHHDGLAGQAVQEGLGVHDAGGHGEEEGDDVGQEIQEVQCAGMPRNAGKNKNKNLAEKGFKLWLNL